jgi:ABC-type glycerol-3-phosphate transport system permease component
MFASSRLRLLSSRAALYAAAAMIVVWSTAPFLWQVSTSFQEDRLLTAPTPSILPWPGTLDHFRNIFVVKQFHLYIVNSLIVAGATALLCLCIGAGAAFALSRLRISSRFGILGLILSVSMFPQIAIVAPLYLVASAVGLMNTYVILIIIYLALGLPLVIWVLFGYFETRRRSSTARDRFASSYQ